MKRYFSLVSLMLIMFASTASAQFPGGWGQPPKPQKAISQDPNVRAPKAEVGNYDNKLRQASTSLTYDFNSETCKLRLTCYDKQEDKELSISMDFADDYAAFAKWVKGLAKEAEKMLNNATDENSRLRMNLPKCNLRGSIKENAAANNNGQSFATGLKVDAHFTVNDGIAYWELKFTPQMGGGFGGFGGFGGGPRGGQQQNAGGPKPPTVSFDWTFRTLDEFKKLQEITDKTTLTALNKVLLKQGKEMEANYGK